MKKHYQEIKEKIMNKNKKLDYYFPNKSCVLTGRTEYFIVKDVKKISKEEYELNDYMCKDFYTDINYYGEDF